MRHFEQLSYNERHKIYRGLCEGKSKKQLAEELGRSKSTIFREIRRNSDKYGYLYAEDAHARTKARKYKNKHKITENSFLQSYIIEKLKEGWSPKV